MGLVLHARLKVVPRLRTNLGPPGLSCESSLEREAFSRFLVCSERPGHHCAVSDC